MLNPGPATALGQFLAGGAEPERGVPAIRRRPRRAVRLSRPLAPTIKRMAGLASVPKRLPIEIAAAQSETMRAAGIYYWFDESNLRHGKAMIIGPAGTPYECCPLFFELVMPDNYPFDPPAVKFLTSDGRTRFHPNLYVEGKVCLSILGTWSGPKWSAVMNISTVLTSIQSLLEENPIRNEPSWEKYTLADPRAAAYAEFVRTRLVELSVGDFLRWRGAATAAPIPHWSEFKEVLDEIGEGLFQRLVDVVKAGAAAGPRSYSGLPYGMSGTTHWSEMLAKMGPNR